MKIRAGFVSNSSTSSFVVYGFEIDSEEIKNIIKNFSCIKDKDIDLNSIEWQWNVDWYDIRCEMERITGQEFSFFYDAECFDSFYIGRGLPSLKDDETGKQFKDSVEKMKEQFSIKNNCQIIDRTIVG